MSISERGEGGLRQKICERTKREWRVMGCQYFVFERLERGLSASRACPDAATVLRAPKSQQAPRPLKAFSYHEFMRWHREEPEGACEWRRQIRIWQMMDAGSANPAHPGAPPITATADWTCSPLL